MGLCLGCVPDTVIPLTQECLLHGSKYSIYAQSRSRIRYLIQYHPFPHFQQDTDIPIVFKTADSLLQHVLDYFAPETVNDYVCDLCNLSANSRRPAIKRRFLASLPRFLMITITAPLGPNGLPSEQHPFGPLRDFEQLDLSSVYNSSQSAKCCYTLCSAILY